MFWYTWPRLPAGLGCKESAATNPLVKEVDTGNRAKLQEPIAMQPRRTSSVPYNTHPLLRGEIPTKNAIAWTRQQGHTEVAASVQMRQFVAAATPTQRVTGASETGMTHVSTPRTLPNNSHIDDERDFVDVCGEAQQSHGAGLVHQKQFHDLVSMLSDLPVTVWTGGFQSVLPKRDQAATWPHIHTCPQCCYAQSDDMGARLSATPRQV